MSFITENFLLYSKPAEALYFDFASKEPIIDYHNHLYPRDISENRHFETLTDAWLEGDHYKWRAMRANGISEAYITGAASAKEKFQKWSETVPFTLKNPLYHWTHLELSRYFGIKDLLNETSADAIYTAANEQLKSAGCHDLLEQMNVKVVCTTDDPTDDLKYHQQIKSSGKSIKVLPTFRPDKSLAMNDPATFNAYLDQLSEVSDTDIKSLDDLLSALTKRMDYFHQHGCKLSDHGLNRMPFLLTDQATLDSNFGKVLTGRLLDQEAIEQIQTYILLHLARGYHARGWTQQYHLGALRNTNHRAMRELGPDTGFDTMGDFDQAPTLSAFLNNLDNTEELPKTILYNLNSQDNDLFATMVGNFNDGITPGKMQYGTSWWFLDQKDGIEKQLTSLSNMGLLSRFVGMLTDSRSFLSFPRHEYFRRILCNMIGDDVEKGLLPDDMTLLGTMVQNICYENARRYFDF